MKLKIFKIFKRKKVTRSRKPTGFNPKTRKKRSKTDSSSLQQPKNRKFAVLRSLLVILPIPVIFFSVPMIVKVNKINCNNQYSQCDQTLLSELKMHENTSLYKAKRQLDALLENNPKVKEHAIFFSLPSTLDVHIVEKKPEFALFSNNEYLLIATNGEIISKASSSGLPIVAANTSQNVGEKVNDQILFCLKLMSDFYSTYQISKGTLEGNSLTIQFPQGLKVIFPNAGDEQLLLGSFNLVYNRLNSLKDNSKIGDRQINDLTIDLRFKNPVIR